jgi:predicted AAA+ superfamily ATPase
VERDIRQIENIKDLRAFESFVHLCAAYQSQEFHPAYLARDCGVSQPTIKTWAKLLEASYLVTMLPPFFKNFGKRIIKSPKFYLTDPSMVCFLTRQPAPESLLRSSMGGALFEGLIVSEVWKAFMNRGKEPSIFFWRSQGGLEVDLIIQVGGKLWPVEVKLTSTPTVHHAEPLDLFKEMAGKEASGKGLVVCTVEPEEEIAWNNEGATVVRFLDWLRRLLNDALSGELMDPREVHGLDPKATAFRVV